MKMTVLEDTPNLLRVALSGSFDPEKDEGWSAKLMALAGPGQNVIVDISEVTQMVSIDFGTLLNAARLVERKRGKFVLLKPKPNVASIIQTLGLSAMLNVAMDEATALSILSE